MSEPQSTARSFRSAEVPLIPLCIGLGVLSGVIDIATQYSAVFESPVLSYGWFWLDGSFLLQSIKNLPWLILVPILLMSCVWMIIPSRRPQGLMLFVPCLAFIAIGLICGKIGIEVKKAGFQKAAVRAQPILDGLANYQHKYGKLPDTLSLLVPEFLPSIPSSGLPCCPEYQYAKKPGTCLGAGAPFILELHQRLDGHSDEYFFYRPGAYPGTLCEMTVEKIGDWGHIVW